MLERVARESVEAVIALVVAAGTAGAILGYGAATHPDLIVGYGVLAMGIPLFGIVIGLVTERLVETGEIPGVGVTVDAPDNATTGFYAAATAVMLFGLVVEFATGSPNPVSLVLFVAGGAFCFERAFRRGAKTGGTGA